MGSKVDRLMEWNFLQSFGERQPGEEIQEGELLRAPPLYAPYQTAFQPSANLCREHIAVICTLNSPLPPPRAQPGL